MLPNIFGSSVWNLFYITLLTPIILKWENCAPLLSKYSLWDFIQKALRSLHVLKRFVKYIFWSVASASGDFALNMVRAVIYRFTSYLSENTCDHYEMHFTNINAVTCTHVQLTLCFKGFISKAWKLPTVRSYGYFFWGEGGGVDNVVTDSFCSVPEKLAFFTYLGSSCDPTETVKFIILDNGSSCLV